MSRAEAPPARPWARRLREGGEAAFAMGALVSALAVLFHMAGGY